MITPEILSRINQLAKKQREAGLTDEERTEQSRLRRLYIDNIKNQVKQYLEPMKDASQNQGCSCSCHDKH